MNSGPITFGMMWRQIIRVLLAPSERSAMMNSDDYSDNVLVRGGVPAGREPVGASQRDRRTMGPQVPAPGHARPGNRFHAREQALVGRWLKGVDTGVEADPAMRVSILDSVRPAPPVTTAGQGTG